MDFGRWWVRVLDRTRVVCFDAFELRRWLTLAAASWLAWLGSMSTLQTRWPWPSSDWEIDWMSAPVMLTMASVGLTVGLAVWLLVTFLRSRGQVMFLQLVARTRGQEAQQDLGRLWLSSGPLASELFRTRILLDLSVFALSFLAVGAGLGTAIALSPGDPLSVGAGLPVFASAFLSGTFALVWVLTIYLLDDLALPIAWARQISLRAGLDEAFALLQRRPADLVGFFAFRLVTTLLVALCLVAISCMTCALSWLPFVMAVIAVPFRVLLRSMALDLLHELDPLSYGAYGPVPPR